MVVTASRRILYRLMAFAWCLSLAEPGLSVETTGEGHKVSRVRCERKSEFAIKRKNEERLVSSLRRITGLGKLQFESDGSLKLGDSVAADGGSGEARRILRSAVSSETPFVVEDYSGSNSVTFGQAETEQIYDPQSRKISQLWRLRLDFEDFREMNAPPEVRAAFDEGMTLLHEILHGLGYEDASRAWQLGACEEIVNRVRGELGLPLRDQYFGERWRVTEKLISVRLRFRSPAQNRPRWQYLSFLFNGQDLCSRLGSVR